MPHAFVTCGVYEISSPSGNVYIGSSSNVRHRVNAHFRSLKKGDHHSKPLQRAANLYGVEALKHRLLCECPREDLRELEQLVIDMVRPKYNATDDTRTPLDFLWTQEAFREKIKVTSARTAKQLWADPAFRAHKSENSRTVCAAVLARPDVRKLSAEISSAALVELWKNQEHRAKMTACSSAHLKQRWQNPEFREQMQMHLKAAGRKGHAAMVSKPENREKMRLNGLAQVKNLRDPQARQKNVQAIRVTRGRRIRCVENGREFETISDAASAVGVRAQGISAVLAGKAKRAGTFTWEYVIAGGSR